MLEYFMIIVQMCGIFVASTFGIGFLYCGLRNANPSIKYAPLIFGIGMCMALSRVVI